MVWGWGDGEVGEGVLDGGNFVRRIWICFSLSRWEMVCNFSPG